MLGSAGFIGSSKTILGSRSWLLVSSGSIKAVLRLRDLVPIGNVCNKAGDVKVTKG